MSANQEIDTPIKARIGRGRRFVRDMERKVSSMIIWSCPTCGKTVKRTVEMGLDSPKCFNCGDYMVRKK